MKTQIVSGVVTAFAIAGVAVLLEAASDGVLVRWLGGTTQEEVTALSTEIATLNTEIAALSTEMLRECRVCFQEIERSSQCSGSNTTCSGWATPGNENTGWTDAFRDDTDGRTGGCRYRWRLECR